MQVFIHAGIKKRMDYDSTQIENQLLASYRELVRVAIKDAFDGVLRSPDHFITLALILESYIPQLALEYRQQAAELNERLNRSESQ